MSELSTVLLLSLLPGIGNFAGGMLAEFWKTSPRLLNGALHAAAGVVMAVVAVELVPEALRTLAGWWIAAAFAAGGGVYVLLDWLLEAQGEQQAGEGRRRMWMIYVAVAVDLTSDGLMIGAGSAVSSSLALILAAGQVLADVPEGYATVANFRDKGIGRRRRVLFSASFFLYAVGAALVSYFLLRHAAQGLKAGALVFVAGLLSVAAVEDMLQEAHEAREDSRRSVLAFVGGFALFTLVSAGLRTITSGG